MLTLGRMTVIAWTITHSRRTARNKAITGENLSLTLTSPALAVLVTDMIVDFTCSLASVTRNALDHPTPLFHKQSNNVSS